MGLFDKKLCCICGAKAGMLTRQKIAGDYICGDCRLKCSPQMTSRQFEVMSADDVRAHMEYVAQNEALYNSEFRETYAINTGILGGTHVVSIDERNGWWVPAGTAKPDILTFDQIISWHLKLDTTYLSDEERRRPNRPFMPMPPYGMPACPPDQKITGMKVIVRVDHPWFDQVELTVMNALFVTDGDIAAGYECAQRIFMYFDQQVNAVRASVYAQSVAQSAMQQPASASTEDPIETIRKLKGLLDIGAITQEEFEAKKRQLLNL